MSNDFHCSACPTRATRTGAEVTTGGPITGPIPYGEPLHGQLLSSVCDVCWQDWLQMQIKVINELALNLGDPRSHEILAAHVVDYLGLVAGNASGTDFAKIGENPVEPTQH